jgi:Ice-binding-like/PASTA domain
MKKLAMLLFVLSLCVSAADATSIDLKTAGSFGALAGSGVTNAVAGTIINGDVGSYPTPAVSGLLPGDVNGILYLAASPVVAQAKLDLVDAYNAAVGAVDGNTSEPVDLSGKTLDPNIYAIGAANFSAGNLILDANGDPNAQWIFHTTVLTTAADFNVLLIRGASASNVFWQVGTSATIAIRNKFAGNILAMTSITLNGTGTLNGRALARNGAVTISSIMTINVPNYVPGEANVPNVVGQTYADANTAITAASFTVGTITTDYNNTVAAGRVISQNPVGGTAATSRTAVDMVVSLGSSLNKAVLVYKLTTAINPVIDYNDANGIEAEVQFWKKNLSVYVVFGVDINNYVVVRTHHVDGNDVKDADNPTAVLFFKDGSDKDKVTVGGDDPCASVSISTFGSDDSFKPFVVTNMRNTYATAVGIEFKDSNVTTGFDIGTSLYGKNTTIDIGQAKKLSVPKSLKGQIWFGSDGQLIEVLGTATATLDSKLTKDANKNSRTVKETVANIQTTVLHDYTAVSIIFSD